MDIKVEIAKNNKDFKFIENNEIILKGVRPKWYSSETIFFLNNNTYEIKKKSLWSTKTFMFKSGVLRGKILYNWRKGYSFEIYENNTQKDQFNLNTENPMGWFKSDRLYTLVNKDNQNILSIYYSRKKWKEVIEAEVVNKSTESYELLIYALYIMRLQQQAESSTSTTYV